MNFKKTILLTGAGFTANFGGFLAKQMWSKIFNNPKLSNAGNLKRMLREKFDFEEIYSDIIGSRSRLQEHESVIFIEALNEAYSIMDEEIRSHTDESDGIQHSDLRQFLKHFMESNGDESGACFTLNQDLFIEWELEWQPLVPPRMFFAGGRYQGWHISDSNHVKQMPTQEEIDTLMQQSHQQCYIKLHGSQNWITADGSAKILGINKRETIERIPLLKWYFSLFEQALYRENVKLVVIGYRFRDKHVNDCLIKARNEYGLKIYNITTEKPDVFSDRMKYKQSQRAVIRETDTGGITLWNAIEGYFQYRLTDIFPYPQRPTVAKSELFNTCGIPFR